MFLLIFPLTTPSFIYITIWVCNFGQNYFFCNAYVSNQKPNVENINKQLRLYFPKGKTIDNYSKQDIKKINQALLNRPLKSLDNFTPKDAFIRVFDEELFNKLF